MESNKPVYCVDMGGGKSTCLVLENLSPTLTTTHYGEPIVFYEENEVETVKNTSDLVRKKTSTLLLNSSGGDIASTLDASYYKGCGLRQGIEREFVVLEVDDERRRHSDC